MSETKKKKKCIDLMGEIVTNARETFLITYKSYCRAITLRQGRCRRRKIVLASNQLAFVYI